MIKFDNNILLSKAYCLKLKPNDHTRQGITRDKVSYETRYHTRQGIIRDKVHSKKYVHSIPEPNDKMLFNRLL